MNDKNKTKTEIREGNSPEVEVRDWIASEAGHRALCRVLDEAREATSILARDCQVKRESLHEPVTV